ncbi:hypothetical protein G6F57_015171 [Rhizopus arrhizus]|nr:hypothetical protein G6F57_015171 [Rhizopus arrhizus]
MHREQAVAAAGDRVAQLHRHLLQHILQALAFQLPAAVQQLARGQVGEHHAGDAIAAGRDQQHRHRRVLHHGVEQQFALHQPLPLRTQHIAQLAVRLHQVAQLIIARPVHAEVVLTIAVAAGGAGERAHQRAHRCGRAAQGPPHQRQQDQRRYRGDHPAVIHPVRQQPRQRGSQRQHRQQAQEQAEGERAPLHSRGMPWRSMRRYSAWRLSPSSAAACAITPWLLDRAVAVAATVVVVGQVHAGIADASLTVHVVPQFRGAAQQPRTLRILGVGHQFRLAALLVGGTTWKILPEALADDRARLLQRQADLRPTERNERHRRQDHFVHRKPLPLALYAERGDLVLRVLPAGRWCIRGQPGVGRAIGLLIDVPALQRTRRQGIEQRGEVGAGHWCGNRRVCRGCFAGQLRRALATGQRQCHGQQCDVARTPA